MKIKTSPQRWFGWDGGADSLWAATLRPILSPLELDGNIAGIAERLRTLPAVTRAFNLVDSGNVLENDEALVVLASKAIAAYVRTLTSKSTPFDAYRTAVLEERESESDYPADARRGLSIFFGEANCHVCHSLRNLMYTAPYMHDGSLATLREVVDAYADIDPERIHSDGEAIIQPLDLDGQEREFDE